MQVKYLGIYSILKQLHLPTSGTMFICTMSISGDDGSLPLAKLGGNISAGVEFVSQGEAW